MGLVMLFFAACLAVAAWRADDKAMRWFLLAGMALNLWAFLDMLASQHPHTFHLAPPSDDAEPSYRR
jgi:hypothetical protein